MLSGVSSGLPGQDGAIDTLGVFRCLGDEETLADCTVVDYNFAGDSVFVDYSFTDDSGDSAIALLCSTPSGVPCAARCYTLVAMLVVCCVCAECGCV